MSFPKDYLERIYAGVLGKLIGVYLGRPFEGWTYQRIMKELVVHHSDFDSLAVAG
jgi:ADP-ribosylglycohydrolase